MYNKTSEAKARDPHYQLNVNETANWTLIGEKIEQKGERIVDESERYKQEHKTISEERDQFYAECVKEWKREKQGKGLYDTSSSSDEPIDEQQEQEIANLEEEVEPNLQIQQINKENVTG